MLRRSEGRCVNDPERKVNDLFIRSANNINVLRYGTCSMRQKKVATLLFAPFLSLRSHATLNLSSPLRRFVLWMAPSDRLVYMLSEKYRMSIHSSHPWRVTLFPDRRMAVGKDRWCTLATASFQKNLWGILPF